MTEARAYNDDELFSAHDAFIAFQADLATVTDPALRGEVVVEPVVDRPIKLVKRPLETESLEQTAQRRARAAKEIRALSIQLGSAKDELWLQLANCRGFDPNMFFLEPGKSTAVAKAICRGCLVREECAEYAITNNEPSGIWGGLTDRARRRIRRLRKYESTAG